MFMIANQSIINIRSDADLQYAINVRKFEFTLKARSPFVPNVVVGLLCKQVGTENQYLYLE